MIVANNFGYLQVHQKDFGRSLDLSMDQATLPSFNGEKGPLVVSIGSFPWSAWTTRELVLGIEPQHERLDCSLQIRLFLGMFLNGFDQVVVSEGWQSLKVVVGTPIVFESRLSWSQCLWPIRGERHRKNHKP